MSPAEEEPSPHFIPCGGQGRGAGYTVETPQKFDVCQYECCDSLCFVWTLKRVWIAKKVWIAKNVLT